MSTYVLLHGFTGGPRSWDALARRLPRRARVLRPTLAGHRSAPAATAWRDEIDRLARWVLREDVRDAHLVGYSLGGRLALGLLERDPSPFARATLIGAHPGLHDPRERDARRARDASWIELLEARGIEAFVDAWEAQPIFETQRRLPAATRAARRRERLGHRADGLASALSALGLAQMPPVTAAHIPTEIELVVGGLDRTHLALSSALARALPRGRVRAVEGVGHDVVLERVDQVLGRAS
jgi:2-succinyl-6-hydroxy-2,4-cyclohexadiene-1-carboxylate synthase